MCLDCIINECSLSPIPSTHNNEWIVYWKEGLKSKEEEEGCVLCYPPPSIIFVIFWTGVVYFDQPAGAPRS